MFVHSTTYSTRRSPFMVSLLCLAVLLLVGCDGGNGDDGNNDPNNGRPDAGMNNGTDPGQCCLPDGTCQQLTEEKCHDQDGGFYGPGTQCMSDMCCSEPMGACCIPDGSCVDGVTPTVCDERGGTFTTGASCSDVDCPSPAACCLPDGSCQEVSPDDCAELDGIYNGGLTCNDQPLECPIDEAACCLPDGSCQEMSEEECLDADGDYNMGMGCDDIDTCDPVEPCTHEVTLTATADDRFDAFVDGQLWGSQTGWSNTYQLTTQLGPGQHVIAVHAEDTARVVAGFIAELTVDGSPLAASATPGDWRVTDTAPSAAWNSVGFNASSWTQPPTTASNCSGTYWTGNNTVPANASWVWEPDCSQPAQTPENWYRFEFELGPCESACCLPDGTCTETNGRSCQAQNGDFFPNQDCTDVDECRVLEDGACCRPDGSCVETTAQYCDPGTFFPGDTCNDVKCDAGCAPPPTGMVAWWSADGHPNDITGTGNDGTLLGNTSYMTGQVNQAFRLPGVATEYVHVPHDSTLNPGTGSFTIDGWINPQSVTAPDIIPIVDKRDPNNLAGYTVYIAGGTLIVQLQGGSIACQSSTPVVAQTWTHFGAVLDRGTDECRVYLDGSLDATTTLSSVAPTNIANNDRLRIGGEVNEREFYTGAIDEVEIFDRALSDLEIQRIYDAGGEGKCRDDLTGCCCLPDGTNMQTTETECEDRSGFFGGAGTSCGAEFCAQNVPGACCLAAGCQDVSWQDCSGQFQGTWTNCSQSGVCN